MAIGRQIRGGRVKMQAASRRCWLRACLLVLLLAQPLVKAVRTRHSIRELQKLMNQQPSSNHGACDPDGVCDWSWSNNTFREVSAPLPGQLAPTADANNNGRGKFLWLSGNTTGLLRSRIIPPTGPDCYLELAVHQVEMAHGIITLLIQTWEPLDTLNGTNTTTFVAMERPGNNSFKWEIMKINLGSKRQDFAILLEIKLPYDNSSIAIDNIRLANCFPDQRTFSQAECTDMMFRCKNGSCLRRDHVCDLTVDCSDGEDEAGECLKVPEAARCTFENGSCGWENPNQLKWQLRRGPSEKQRMGPMADHTYGNGNGTYAVVEMSSGGVMGNEAVLKSPIFNPMPPYHSDPRSPYVSSCKMRFFYYQVNGNTIGFSLKLVKILPHQTHPEQLYWSFPSSDRWQSFAVSLPTSSTRYYLQFEAIKGYSSNGLIAIDDISLSPECFGIGVPPEVVENFNYYDQKIDDPPPKHPDFTNVTIVTIDTCNQTGRFGPTAEQCAKAHNRSDVEILSEQSTDKNDATLRSKGIQRWTAPSDGYYTIIAAGAQGGQGALSVGISFGAKVQGVIELQKGQRLYFMVGQPGTAACPKRLGSTNDTCHRGKSNFTVESLLDIKKIQLTDGGGGGGGATYVFTLKKNEEQVPLLIAAGGGGLGPSQFQDDQQHAKGVLPNNLKPINGTSLKEKSGGGGGWLSGTANETNDMAYGMALTLGGVGGVGCGPNRRDSNDSGFGDGGFGGGGGGCLSGGGGGGYAGGDTGHTQSGNGAGGYSFISPEMLYAIEEEKQNSGPGEVVIIAEKEGCGCEYRCIALDRYLSETRCICPQGSYLHDDGRSCKSGDEKDESMQQIAMVFMVAVTVVLIISLSCLCLLLYNRYQQRKILEKRRQVMFGNGTELTSLRTVSNNMISEFNPNYEFAGSLYSLKDLPQIPRESITLVKALGQGAFGEVFQGVYRIELDEYPVAVKTLPPTPAPQAEADFVMEALIMSKFDHPNIVRFIGVSFTDHPRYIVLELLAGGDLKNFLREERPRPDLPTSLTMRNLLACAQDVAKGCQFMEESRFIHRDIAARNCLLTCKGPGRVVKVADFGMARDIYRSEYYKKGGNAMLPVKWMPPESFIDGVFSSKTDVWSYGVLLWEIMSFGYMPYTGCSNREVMTMVTQGGRLEKPVGCPDPIYGIMSSCWNPIPSDRPTFATIINRLELCVQDPDVINYPMPSFEILPLFEREMTVMRPNTATECIDIRAELDKHGYMQPRIFYQANAMSQPPAEGQPVPSGIVYASLKLQEDRDNCNELKRPAAPGQLNDEPNDSEHDRIYDNKVFSSVSSSNSSSTEPETNPNVMLDSVEDDTGFVASKDVKPKATTSSSSKLGQSVVNFNANSVNNNRNNNNNANNNSNNNNKCSSSAAGTSGSGKNNINNNNNNNNNTSSSSSNSNNNAVGSAKASPLLSSLRPDAGRNGNDESTATTDTNSDSLLLSSTTGSPPDIASTSTPNTRASSPSRAQGSPKTAASRLASNGNVNGLIRKNALKAALSLDPSALCREKMAFTAGSTTHAAILANSPAPTGGNSTPDNAPGSTNTDPADLQKAHELPREECSC